MANKSGGICLGEEHVVSLYGCSAAFLLLEIIIKKDENNISQRRWQGKNLTDVENGVPFGADENGSQGAPVSKMREGLRYTLPGNSIEEVRKVLKVMPATAFVRKEGVMTLNEYNGVVMTFCGGFRKRVR